MDSLDQIMRIYNVEKLKHWLTLYRQLWPQTYLELEVMQLALIFVELLLNGFGIA